MTESYIKIKKAIEETKQIEFEYHKPGKPNPEGKRIGHPHIIYILTNSDSNEKRVDIVQISGEGTNNPSLPKPYLLEYIKNVKVLETTFSKSSEYNSSAPRYLKKLIDIEENAN